jgi:hypothetical protein
LFGPRNVPEAPDHRDTVQQEKPIEQIFQRDCESDSLTAPRVHRCLIAAAVR